MKGRIQDKVREIESYLREMGRIHPKSLNEYLDIKNKAACERYFEKIVEAVVDLAYLIIRDLKIETPEDDKIAFKRLAEEGIIADKLVEKLKDAKGMRNILAHEYGRINDSIVYNSLNELEKDVKELVKSVKQHYR
jgi:uncharacterized protein YutE (UPF0331/DUF86 family)